MKKQRPFFGIFRTSLTAVLMAFFLLGTPSSALASSPISGVCNSITLSVALVPGQPINQKVRGTLCLPNHWGSKHEVDVLMHGGTYNSTYWNWPIETSSYSYVNNTLLAGRATFAYDAIGAGQSSHPLSTTLAVDGEAYVLHEVLNWLRGHHTYESYVVIGHSLGSVTAVAEAATYHDEDALVLTSFAHAFNPVHALALGAGLHPADLDPQFLGQLLDPGYLTTMPGVRKTLFYSTDAEPAIIAYDEAHKDAFAATLFAGAFTQLGMPAALNASNSVTVPVLEIVGGSDFAFCGVGALVDCTSAAAIHTFDAPYYAHAPSFTVVSMPRTGHDLALHPTSFTSFSIINVWIESH